ncbi:MAG: sulfatase/phosphatase domain-containing protein [Bryobacteraceae bacterium]
MPVSRREFFMGSLALPVLAAKKPKVAPEKPSVLLIVVDDLPSWLTGCYGNKEILTPNIDQLARTGTRFLNHFVAVPEAEANFRTLITGRTPMQIGPSGTLAPDDITLEKMLAGGGYACHSTSRQPLADVTAEALGLLDAFDGKQTFWMVRYGDLRPPYEGIPAKFLDLYANRRFENYTVEPVAPNATGDKELLANRLLSRRRAAAAISAVDDAVGTLIRKIYQKQAVDHVLVILTATCGSLFGAHGLWGAGDASDPPNMFEESVRVPLIWSWPGRVPAEGVQVELVSTYDLVPSVADIAEIELPKRNLCGRSYVPLATGKLLTRKESWRQAVCARERDTEMARVERYKLILRNQGKGPNELYDYATDPGEHTNLADNDQYVSIRGALADEIQKWKVNYSG